MKVDKLSRFNLPASLLDSWKKNQGEELLPLQVQAVTRCGLLEGKSLLISSPTSSGKTFCGEMAAAAHLSVGRKVVYLVPLKAVAEEKYRDFLNKYARLGIKVLISTADHPENDFDLEKGKFDLALLVYEKFNQLLVKKLNLMHTVSLVVLDELQLIFDPSRGPVLEKALAKLRLFSEKLQVIGLSSVLDNAEVLADWLGCQLLVQKQRPVELFQGVLWNGVYRFRGHNSGQEGEEKLGWKDNLEPLETLFSNLEQLLSQGEQTLVFLKSKAEVESAALLFAQRVKLPQAVQALQQLSESEPTSGRDKLLHTLSSAVAFHNADLTHAERKLVEDFYLAGEIKVIFCTTTLSLGVNLPAKTVFLEPLKYQNAASQAAVLLPLEWAEYENISGRAGRLGQQDSGKAILIANSEFEAETLWERYIEARPSMPLGQLFNSGSEEVILDYLAAANNATLESLRDYLQSTLSFRRFDFALFEPVFDSEVAQTRGEPQSRRHRPENIEGLKEFHLVLDETLAQLCRQHLLTRDNFGRISITNLGRVAALQNISAQTALRFHSQLPQFRPDDQFTLLYSLLSAPEAKAFYPYLSLGERRSRNFVKLLSEKISSGQVKSADLVELLHQPELLTLEILQNLKTCFLLEEWIERAEIKELEKKYQIRAGQIYQIGEQTGWLCSTAALIAQFQLPELYPFLSTLAARLRQGLSAEGLYLATFKIEDLGRNRILALERAGLIDRNSIVTAGLEQMKKYLPEKIAQALLDKLSAEKTPDIPQPEEATGKLSICIEGRPVKNRYSVIINNQSLTLPAKSFMLLTKLAVALVNNPDGWVHKDQLESGFNQSRYISRLKKELLPYLPEGYNLIENNRLGGYRLNLTKENLKVEWGNLEKVEDEEVRSLSQKYG
jgi:helicase